MYIFVIVIEITFEFVYNFFFFSERLPRQHLIVTPHTMQISWSVGPRIICCKTFFAYVKLILDFPLEKQTW